MRKHGNRYRLVVALLLPLPAQSLCQGILPLYPPSRFLFTTPCTVLGVAEDTTPLAAAAAAEVQPLWLAERFKLQQMAVMAGGRAAAALVVLQQIMLAAHKSLSQPVSKYSFMSGSGAGAVPAETVPAGGGAMAITAAAAAVALPAAGAEAKAQAPVAVQEEPPFPTPAVQVAAVRADGAVGTAAGVAPERLRLEDRLMLGGAAVVQVEAPVAPTIM